MKAGGRRKWNTRMKRRMGLGGGKDMKVLEVEMDTL